MTRYAQNTDVSSDKSRNEIERTLTRYGATAFGYGWQEKNSVIMFEARGRRIKFVLPMPSRKDKEICETATGLPRAQAAVESAYEQAVRQKWRALALCIKAKLEAVEAGITEFEEEFLAHIVLPNGQRAGEWMRPQIATAYESRKMPPLLGYDGDAA